MSDHAHDLAILIKTLSDASGLTKLGGYIKSHSIAVKGMIVAYEKFSAVAKAAGNLVGGVVSKQFEMMRNGALAVAGGLAFAIREGNRFNKELSQTVNSMSGNRIANWFKLREAVLRLSNAYGIATSEFVSGFNAAADAGLNASQSFEALNTVAKMTQAVGGDLGNVFQLMTVAINRNFGESWYKTMSFQQALKKLYDQAGDSVVRMKKIFGFSWKELQPYKDAIKDLDTAARFAAGNQAPWTRVWNTALNLVKEIGSEIEQRWAPRIKYVADQFDKIRNTTEFKNAVRDIADWLDKAAVNVIAGFKTAKEILEDLPDAAAFVNIGKVAVIELVKLAAVTLWNEILAGKDILVGIAKVMSAAFAEDLLAIVPGVSLAIRMGAEAEIDRILATVKNADELMAQGPRLDYLKRLASKDSSVQAGALRENANASMNRSIAELPDRMAERGGAIEAQANSAGKNIGAATDAELERLYGKPGAEDSDIYSPVDDNGHRRGRSVAEKFKNNKSQLPPSAQDQASAFARKRLAERQAVAQSAEDRYVDALNSKTGSDADIAMKGRQAAQQQALVNKMAKTFEELLTGNQEVLQQMLASMEQYNASLKQTKAKIKNNLSP